MSRPGAALEAGIAEVRASARLGDVGATIQPIARGAGYGLLREYCGHGIGRQMHMDPQVPHYGRPGHGLRLRAGMASTIEPMLKQGIDLCMTQGDGWTVCTADGRPSARFEHTIVVTEESCETTTRRGVCRSGSTPWCHAILRFAGTSLAAVVLAAEVPRDDLTPGRNLMNASDKTAQPEIYLTDQDLDRLGVLVEQTLDGGLTEPAERLATELARAQVVAQDRIPKDVVTMRSRAVCRDLQTGKVRELELVYPREADMAAGRVSVLAPVGAALLGLRVGSTIEWPLPRGRTASLELLEVLYQPEAVGAFDQ